MGTFDEVDDCSGASRYDCDEPVAALADADVWDAMLWLLVLSGADAVG